MTIGNAAQCAPARAVSRKKKKKKTRTRAFFERLDWLWPVKSVLSIFPHPGSPSQFKKKGKRKSIVDY